MYFYNYAGHDNARRLVAVGDSFVWGCIKDPVDYQGRRGPQQAEPFTQLIAKNLKLDYAEHGIRGGSNWDIYTALITMNVVFTDLVIVAWSGTDRQECDVHDDKPDSPRKWLDAIVSATEYLDNIGCEYYYLSSFQDYRLSAPEPVPEHCTRNWLWYHEPYSSLYDLCAKGSQTNPIKQGEFEHGSYPDTDIPLEEYRYLSEKFSRISPYIAGCHHPSQLGHELLANIIQEQIGLLDK